MALVHGNLVGLVVGKGRSSRPFVSPQPDGRPAAFLVLAVATVEVCVRRGMSMQFWPTCLARSGIHLNGCESTVEGGYEPSLAPRVRPVCWKLLLHTSKTPKRNLQQLAYYPCRPFDPTDPA